jgi:hypothetical protein
MGKRCATYRHLSVNSLKRSFALSWIVVEMPTLSQNPDHSFVFLGGPEPDGLFRMPRLIDSTPNAEPQPDRRATRATPERDQRPQQPRSKR